MQLIGLDTNILVRYLICDDPNQFKKAEEIIEGAIKHRQLLHITLIVLCEVVWVLDYHYKIEHKQIGQFLNSLLHTEQIEVENRQLALKTLLEYQNSKADFADCLIALTNHAVGCTTTYTFDKKAAKHQLFTHL